MTCETEMSVSEKNDLYENINYKLWLILRTGQALMENGADTNRIFRDMVRIAVYFGIPEHHIRLQVFFRTIMINVGDRKHSYTSFCKCWRHGANMATISQVSRLTWQAMEEHFTLEQYDAALNSIRQRPRCYPAYASAPAAALATASLAVLFGCDIYAAVLTAACTLLAFFTRRKLDAWQVNQFAGVALATFVSTFAAYLTTLVSGSSTPFIPMIACSLLFVPGIPLINAVDDLVNTFNTAGLTRAMNTLLVIGAMALGMVLTVRLCQLPNFTTLDVAPDGVRLLHALAAASATLGFSVMFNVPRRLLRFTVLGGVLAVLLRNYLLLNVGIAATTSAAIASLAVSVWALACSHIMRVPTHVISVPCVIPLIPGIPLYRMLFSLIYIRTLPAAEFYLALQGGIEAALVVITIAMGVAIPNLAFRHYLDREKVRRIAELLSEGGEEFRS